MQQILERSVVYVKGVGPKRAELFEKVGVSTVYDLLQYCPRDYIDLSAPCEIKNAQGEDPLVIRARVVKKMPPARIRKGLTVCKAVFTDDTDDITVTLYNQEYLFASLKEGEDYILYGKVAGNMVRREMNSPMVFSAASPDLILPVYPLTEGLSQNIIRKAVRGALDLVLGEVEDIMPQYVRDSCRMCSLACAWENIHFPKSLYGAHEARRRLIFDELLIHSLAIAYQRQNEDSDSNYIMQAQPLEEFTSALPFTLTKTQLRSLNDCTVAMRGAHRMNRLIQGDVGCGKTVVAAGAAWFAYNIHSCAVLHTECDDGAYRDTRGAALQDFQEPAGAARRKGGAADRFAYAEK